METVRRPTPAHVTAGGLGPCVSQLFVLLAAFKAVASTRPGLVNAFQDGRASSVTDQPATRHVLMACAWKVQLSMSLHCSLSTNVFVMLDGQEAIVLQRFVRRIALLRGPGAPSLVGVAVTINGMAHCVMNAAVDSPGSNVLLPLALVDVMAPAFCLVSVLATMGIVGLFATSVPP